LLVVPRYLFAHHQRLRRKKAIENGEESDGSQTRKARRDGAEGSGPLRSTSHARPAERAVGSARSLRRQGQDNWTRLMVPYIGLRACRPILNPSWRKSMRLLIVCGMLALASLASLTPANARSLIGRFCRSQCGVAAVSGRVMAPSSRTCVNKCLAGKKASQH
jgi:hypothetical protein